MGVLFEQLPKAQVRLKRKYFFVHQIANERTIILSTENVQKVLSGPKLWLKFVDGQKARMVKSGPPYLLLVRKKKLQMDSESKDME